MKLNSNIETEASLDEPEKVIELQKNKLQILADFLKVNMVNKLIDEIINDSEKNFITSDYQNFTMFLHFYGINIRYLGHIYQVFLKKGKEYPNVI